MSDEIYIICSSCLETKQSSEYYRSSTSKTGFRNRCKSCDRESVIKSNNENPGWRNEYLKQWRKNNPEKAKQIADRNAKNNREKINERKRKYRKENAEEINAKERERQSKKRKENPQQKRDYARNYNKRHPDKQKARTKRKVENVTDSYISAIICKRSNLKRSDIPQNFIELRRELLTLGREIKILSN